MSNDIEKFFQDLCDKIDLEKLLFEAFASDNYQDIIRADGRCICEICGKEYLKHPFSEHKSSDGEPYLNKLCDGTLVKL